MENKNQCGVPMLRGEYFSASALSRIKAVRRALPEWNFYRVVVEHCIILIMQVHILVTES